MSLRATLVQFKTASHTSASWLSQPDSRQTARHVPCMSVTRAEPSSLHKWHSVGKLKSNILKSIKAVLLQNIAFYGSQCAVAVLLLCISSKNKVAYLEGVLSQSSESVLPTSLVTSDSRFSQLQTFNPSVYSMDHFLNNRTFYIMHLWACFGWLSQWTMITSLCCVNRLDFVKFCVR